VVRLLEEEHIQDMLQGLVGKLLKKEKNENKKEIE
jgi:hypothetical protein